MPQRLQEDSRACHHEVRRIPVTSHGKLVGVIAQADIASANEIPKEQVADVVKKVSEPAHPAR
jgi:predicted transcriptional regulator